MKRILSVLVGLTVGILTGWGVAALASRSSTGTYTLPSGNPVVTGTTITSTWANNTLSDVSTELTDSLSRSGYGGMLAPLRLTNGSASAPSLSFSSDTNTGIYRGAADDLRISAGGAQVLACTSAGLSVTNAITASTSITATTSLTVGTTITASTASGSTLGPLSVYTGDASAQNPTLTMTGRNGTTGGGRALTITGGNATVSGTAGPAIYAIGGTATTAGQGGAAITAVAGTSVTVGANAIDATGNLAGAGISGTGGSTGPGGTFTAGTTATPQVGNLYLVPVGATPSSPIDGNIWVKSSGTLGWRANSTSYYPQKGGCNLNAGSPATCNITVTSGVTYCVANPVGTTAAVAARPVATSISGTTVTVTGPNADADSVAIICM